MKKMRKVSLEFVRSPGCFVSDLGGRMGAWMVS